MTESNTEAVTKDERAAPEIYVWFAESKSSLAQGERFIRAWTDNPDRVENLRKAIGLDPVTYRDNGADAASTDDVIDLAVALEQKRALHIVAAVRAQGFAKSSGAVPTQAESVFDLACEEIEHRLRTETWEIGGVTGPLPEERTALTSDVAQAPVGYVSRAAFTEISQGSQQWAKLFSVQSTGTPGNMVPVYAAPVAPTPETAPALTYPADFTDDLKWILGLVCFQCIQYAQALRKGGRDVPSKAEAEQAATLDFLLRHYMSNPEHWREAASRELREMNALAATAPSDAEKKDAD